MLDHSSEACLHDFNIYPALSIPSILKPKITRSTSFGLRKFMSLQSTDLVKMRKAEFSVWLRVCKSHPDDLYSINSIHHFAKAKYTACWQILYMVAFETSPNGHADTTHIQPVIDDFATSTFLISLWINHSLPFNAYFLWLNKFWGTGSFHSSSSLCPRGKCLRVDQSETTFAEVNQ